MLKQDNKKVCRIERDITTNCGGGYTPESFINVKKDLLSKLAYYGYAKTKQSH
ncbi:hypothetical protein LM600727_30651 [Listeria monocytogenes]|nr:hypothetical protein LM600727_30651 [Listeria monocytogenes]CUK70428.1 hypothetical protein LM601244_40523 [Listeria monocytogenes]CUK81362.1 hypothetical protein LM700514_40608 [Listeria monocytogenes]CUL04131.1 hypothetical protein LM701145_100264 [Listeria monocytogenes]